MKKVVRLLTSVRISILIFIVIISGGVSATLIPQGMAPDFYRTNYPVYVAGIILGSGFDHYFTSVVFLVPAALFFVNLAACTVKRLIRELKSAGKRRPGPVVLHLGLMILVVGAVISFTTRREALVFLTPGEKVELPGNRQLVLLDFDFRRYPDGRPQDWVSGIRILRDGTVETDRFELRVNNPLKIGRIQLYQSSWGSVPVLEIADSAKGTAILRQGESISYGDGTLQFMGSDGGSGGIVLKIGRADERRIVHAEIGDRFDTVELSGLFLRETSGIQAVEDLGYPVVLIGLLISGVGLFLTFYEKLRVSMT